MGIKGPEVHETRLLGGQDGSPEKQSRKTWSPFVFHSSRDSECSLDSVHKHGWKPLTLSAPVLFSFAFASFLLAVIVEILAQQSQAKGGLALSESADDIPPLANFCYLFLPTIVAVIYSLLWSWIDLDVKRMQPWLEMSKPEGADADHSVFLDYPYDFIAFVPMKAARRRHWPVFYGGTVMVIIFWLITPLQSAILGTGPVDVQRLINTTTSEKTIPSSEQPFILDQSLLNEGYAITWLNQSLPPFTAPEYTLLPFAADTEREHTPTTNWTGSTTKFWTQLECWPGDISHHGSELKKTYDFSNGRGCNASDIDVYGYTSDTMPYKMLYVGYQNSAWADYYLERDDTCPPSAAGHQFLSMWSRYNATSKEIKIASAFCETSYFKQQVNVTVSSADQAPIEGSLISIGPRERLPGTEFNFTAFEHLLGVGVSSVEGTARREYPFQGILLEHYQQVEDLGISWPMSPMVGFAIAAQNRTPLESFKNEAVMGDAYNTTHKMLFSLALRRVLANDTLTVTSEGSVEFVLHGIIVSRLFSAIVEGFLVLVGIFTFLIWWHSFRAESRLTMDPASLGSLISLCQNSTVLLDRFAGKGAVSEDTLKKAFRDQRFKLLCGCQSRTRQMVIKVVDVRDEPTEGQRISLTQPEAPFSVGHYSPVKPLALRRGVGLAVIVTMISAVVALVYLKLEEKRNRGLIRPTTNFEVLQILENYVPTIFATFLEPFWVLVNRLLCIIQPFRDLWTGRKTAGGSINARYTSVPPQLALWRAAKSGHFMLMAICVLALLSNLLAVGLGGLFNEFPVVIESTQDFQQTLRPQLNNTSIYSSETSRLFASSVAAYAVPFYITMNNISQGTPLPAWITHDYFFQPFTLGPGGKGTSDSYTARTRGFGLNPSCSSIGTFESTVKAPVINYTYIRNGEAVPDCPTTHQAYSFDFNSTIHPALDGECAAEDVRMFGDSYSLVPCNVAFSMGWGRAPNITNKEDGQMESTFVVCEPTFTTALFDVTVDREGHVYHSVLASEPSPTLDYPLSTNHTDAIAVLLNKIFFKDHLAWHNDSLSLDWFNYLIKISDPDSHVLDPNVFPNATALAPTVERVYRQLYVLMLGLNHFLFDEYQEPITITGVQRKTETRIFMDATAFTISLVVLGINILVAAALYGFSIKHFLPRMPTTIGSILAYVAPSRAVREYDGPESLQAATFSFGRYVGDDGRANVGIDLDPFVVPVKLSSLRKGDTQPRKGLLSRVMGRGGEKRGDTWL
ncbi:hypothetical protein CORC01_09250 [Colletotrichum orchidophilum]|uniref:Uncharacterized protein n=1 Tax=Colletotrichum orchidophilum TaxID=1209926 RepID=A0A1G4B1S9_9PEZI|nr:uncharacterized protein CORC01_09250 [Colletotrichum orchidophilum]OHE95378.1 hypothetical protein CORC01_09250 [Colletotrichum orchidophilum]